MHYRIRGNNVQLVKTAQDPETGKAKSQPVGSANLITGELNDSAKEALSKSEVAEVKKWLKRRQEMIETRRMVEFSMLAERIGAVTAWLKGQDLGKIPESDIEEILYAMQRLKRACGKGRKPEPAA